MAEGALRHSRSQVAVAISGVAGPEGGSMDKPVGTVWLAWAVRGRETRSERVVLDGDRNAVRGRAVELALRGILDVVTP
jgi:nicotinamide-nucleotide amidase